MIQKLILSVFFVLLMNLPIISQPRGTAILESRHYSLVFGETRNFRIFLPPGYSENPDRRYPVIYFFHGWSQRYFGPANQPYSNMDKGDDNDGDNIANFVAKNDVIVVKADGYNRYPDEKYYLRPYNVSPVETFRQFPLYFPELVNYIDDNYNTIPDREHRAVSGLSMGGFMTFWIAGKYPHLVSAAGNFCGSPEFTIGPKYFPVEYRHADMYKNYEGVNLRLNYGDKDFIRYYHRDLNRIWLQVLDNYEYKIYDAAHSTCGLGEMFDFLMQTFENPPAKPLKWSHIDVYPEFTVWDYYVSSDRIVPGFTVLENVDIRGFRSSVREFIPDGELFPFVRTSITTAPVYEKNQLYTINSIDISKRTTSQNMIRSDHSGRLRISVDGNLQEIGINKAGDKPNVCIASIEVKNMNWATTGKEVVLSVKLLNKGMSKADDLKIKLSATRNSAKIIRGDSYLAGIGVNEIKECQLPFSFLVEADTIEIEKFRLTVKDGKNNEWIDYIEIPVKRDLPEIKAFEIADGRTLTVARSGTFEETILLGAGNADGIANPGESIVILVKDQDKLWRTKLYTSDPYVNPYGLNIRHSDNWSNLDHVGGSAKYSAPVISSDCPESHIIEFFAEYWLPEYPDHIIRQGTIKIKVTGKDTTPPQLKWIKIPGDNIIQAKLYDASKIQYVRAKLTSKNNAEEFANIKLKDPENIIHVELFDNGKDGDAFEGDNVFSCKIPEQHFFIYNVEIEAMDEFGNILVEKYPEAFILF